MAKRRTIRTGLPEKGVKLPKRRRGQTYDQSLSMQGEQPETVKNTKDFSNADFRECLDDFGFNVDGATALQNLANAFRATQHTLDDVAAAFQSMRRPLRGMENTPPICNDFTEINISLTTGPTSFDFSVTEMVTSMDLRGYARVPTYPHTVLPDPVVMQHPRSQLDLALPLPSCFPSEFTAINFDYYLETNHQQILRSHDPYVYCNYPKSSYVAATFGLIRMLVDRAFSGGDAIRVMHPSQLLDMTNGAGGPLIYTMDDGESLHHHSEIEMHSMSGSVSCSIHTRGVGSGVIDMPISLFNSARR